MRWVVVLAVDSEADGARGHCVEWCLACGVPGYMTPGGPRPRYGARGPKKSVFGLKLFRALLFGPRFLRVCIIFDVESFVGDAQRRKNGDRGEVREGSARGCHDAAGAPPTP